MARKRFHLWLGCLILTVATFGVVAAGAIADTTSKPWTAVLPEEVGVGPEVTIVATLGNSTNPQDLGSANLTAPEGYRVYEVTASQGTAAITGQDVQLRTLALKPYKTMTVTMKAEVACSEQPGTWKAVGKQSNDFSGLPGNDFTLDTANSRLTTRSQGNCEIRATCVEDDTSSCTKRLIYRGVLTVTEAGAATPLVRSLAGVTAATREIFYELVLETEAFHTDSVPDAGELRMAWQPGQPQDCQGYAEVAPIRGLVVGPQNRTKGIDFTIDQSLMEYYRRDAADLEMCFAAPQPFLVDVAYPTVSTTDVDGIPWFTGILPDCLGDETPAQEPNIGGLTAGDLPQLTPCVYDRTTDAEGNGVISVEVPFTYPDPTFRG